MQINNYQNYHETKQHTTAEFPYNTYPCSIPLDFTRVPLHWHDELELIVIKKGHGLISVDFQKRSSMQETSFYPSGLSSFHRTT